MKSIIAVLLLSLSTTSFAGAIASMPNRAGGKIVLTDEACVHGGRVYDNAYKAYNYGSSGATTDGCFFLQDEVVVVIWDDGKASKMRYPVENFKLKK